MSLLTSACSSQVRRSPPRRTDSGTGSVRNPAAHSHVSSLQQVKRAEEPEFIFRCDVWLKQQCSAEALQDLGGEKATYTMINIFHTLVYSLSYYFFFNFTVSFLLVTCSTFCLYITENTEQDKKNLLCLWAADGKCFNSNSLSTLLSIIQQFSLISFFTVKYSLFPGKLCGNTCHSDIGVFFGSVRIPHATTGPTDWLLLSSVLLTSPSCRCCWKVTDTNQSRIQKHLWGNHQDTNSFYFCLYPDMTFIHEGNPTYVDKLVNFEKMVRLDFFFPLLLFRLISFFKSIPQLQVHENVFLLNVIANARKDS